MLFLEVFFFQLMQIIFLFFRFLMITFPLLLFCNLLAILLILVLLWKFMVFFLTIVKNIKVKGQWSMVLIFEVHDYLFGNC